MAWHQIAPPRRCRRKVSPTVLHGFLLTTGYFYRKVGRHGFSPSDDASFARKSVVENVQTETGVDVPKGRRRCN
jgi:hypothetical protein